MGMFDQFEPTSRGMFGVDTQDQSSLGGVLMDYLRNVMSGQIAAGGALGQNFYDPNRSFAQNALDPRAIENATNIGLSMGVNPIRAFHGSPYDFDKFDPATAKPGFYGRGTYFHREEADAIKHKFSADAPEGGKMYEADLNIRRPFDMQEPVPMEASAIAAEALGKPELAAMIRESGRGYRSGSEFWHWGMGQGGSADAKADALRKAGFDAIIANPNREMTGVTKYSDIVNVLDPSIIEILRKYGILGPIAVPGTLAPFVGDQ